MHRTGTARLFGMLVLAAALAAGCGEAQAPSGVTVEEFRLTREDEAQVVTGTLVNPSDRPLDGVAVEVALYDQPVEPGVMPVETVRVEVQNIAPGERKPFRQTLDTDLTLSGAQVRQIFVY